MRNDATIGTILVLLAGCAAPTANPAPLAPRTSEAPSVREGGDERAGRDEERAPVASRPTVPTVVVERPPFGYALLRRPEDEITASPAPSLKKRSEKRNRITDDHAWFAANELALPTVEVPEHQCPCKGGPFAWLDTPEGRERLAVGIDHGDHAIGIYGDPVEARWVALYGSDRHLERIFDFGSFLTPPSYVEEDRAHVRGRVAWAERVGDVLYVATSHPTYAKSSHGSNAFLTAVDAKRGTLIWQSEPLVSNATNFVVWNGFVLTGYGFTSEPDFVFALDARTGETRRKVPVKSGPTYLIRKGELLHVRTYDTDYVFDLRP